MWGGFVHICMSISLSPPSISFPAMARPGRKALLGTHQSPTGGTRALSSSAHRHPPSLSTQWVGFRSFPNAAGSRLLGFVLIQPSVLGVRTCQSYASLVPPATPQRAMVQVDCWCCCCHWSCVCFAVVCAFQDSTPRSERTRNEKGPGAPRNEEGVEVPLG